MFGFNQRHYDKVNQKLREVESMIDELIEVMDSNGDKYVQNMMLTKIKIEVDYLCKLIFENNYTINADFAIKGEYRKGFQLKMMFEAMLFAMENSINK